MRFMPLFLFAFAALFLPGVAARAAMPAPYTITLKNGKFTPANLSLPANKKIKLTVRNEDAMPVEFESSDLDREQVVAAHDDIIVYLGPLQSGVYNYFDDFNRKITGKITVK